MHGKDMNFSNQNSSLLTACVKQHVNLDVVDSIFTKSDVPSVTIDSKNEDNLDLHGITNDVKNLSMLQNLAQQKTKEEAEPIPKNEGHSKPPTTESTDNSLITLTIATPTSPKIKAEEKSTVQTANKPKEDNLVDINNQTENINIRGGRYNKKTAPSPPKPDQSAPIKATLVLKPGIVKNLTSSEDIPCKEVFVQSPKSKRRSLVSRSPSSVSSCSSNSSRSNKRSLSKLIKFPKKIDFWNKDDTVTKNKRFSLNSLFHRDLKPLTDSKFQSKSDNNLIQSSEVVHGTNLPESDSQVSIRSLTESPLARRRLKIIRRYVDEDID